MPAAAAVPAAVRTAAALRPALTALNRALASMAPATARVGEALARSSSKFKEFVASALTVEKVMQAIRKAMTFVTVADAATRLALALAKLKSQMGQAAAAFGIGGGRQRGAVPGSAAAPPAATVVAAATQVPAAAQVIAAAVASAPPAPPVPPTPLTPPTDALEQAGAEAGEAAQQVGALQGALKTLGDQGFEPAKNAAEAFEKPLKALVYTFEGFVRITKVASNAEQLQLSLENLTGSADGAALAFQMIQDFANRTPVSLESATEAFRQLWTAGILPTQKNLTAFGNVAAGFGKDITAVTSAISGVDLGKVDGLEELGLQVEEQGNKLKITFDGVTTTVGNTSRDVAAYLEQLGTTRFADGMQDQANTFAGGFDQAKETFLAVVAAIGGGGLLTALESMDGSFAKILEAAKPVAELIGKGLGAAMGMAASAAEFLAEHAGVVAAVLAGLSAAAAVAAIGELVKSLSVAKGAIIALGQAVLANPIGLIVGAIAAVVAALVIFKDESVTVGNTTATLGEWMQATWEVTKDRLLGLWEKIKGAWAVVRDFLVEAWEVIKGAIVSGVQKVHSLLASFVEGAAGILGGLGRMLGAVFGALVDGIKNGINFMIAAIASVPQAVGAAVAAIKEGDFANIFSRIREATAGNFDKDFVGDLLGELGDRVGRLATTVSDVVRFTAEGIKDDVVRFGKDIATTAQQIASARPAGGGGLGQPPGRNRPGGGGGIDAEAAAAARALDAIRASTEEARAAFDELTKAPVEQIAQKYQTFKAAAERATQEIEAQKKALRDLGSEHPKVKSALEELDRILASIADQSKAAEPLNEIAKGFDEISSALSNAQDALKGLDSASLDTLLGATEKVDLAMAALDKTIAEQQARLAGLTEGSEQYESVQAKLKEAIEARNKLEAEQAVIVGKISEGTRSALEALQGYATAQSTALKAQKLAEYLAAIEKIKTELAAAKELLAKLEPNTEGFRTAEAHVKSLQGQLEGVEKIAAGQGIEAREPAEDSLKEYADIWNKFVDDAMNSFGDLFLNVLEGNVDSFDDFVDSIKKMFKKMLADMAAAALKKVINIAFNVGGEGQPATGGATGGSFGSFNAGAFNTGGKFDWSKLLGTAAMGYSIGSLVGSFLAEEDNYAELGGQILGVVGAVVGAFFGSPEIGALIGSAIGSLIGSWIKKGLPGTSATLTVTEGRAEVDQFFSRNKGSLDQIRQYATSVVEGINELAALTDGILLDLPDVKLKIHNNKFFEVVDASGIKHKFGEDYEAAVNFAVLEALKGASFGGLSPEVEAAIRNSKATTVEELASDIEFAKEVRDIDLDPVTKDLRDVIRRFNEMSARARELGISLDKVDKAFSKAVNEIKEDILSGLKPFQEAGLTDVEREARRITEAFEEMRENARLFNEELATETQSRNEEIAKLQEELVRQQELLAQAQQNPEDFLSPELLERLAGRGLDPETLTRMATSGIQEVIDQILAEIARLQGLNAAQTPIDLTEIEDAERAARQALRERVRDSLKPYLRLDLTQVQQQLLQLDDTFEKLRRDARAAGVSMAEVDKAYAKAREAIRKQVMDQLQPYLDLAAGMTPLQAELRDLDERFKELRTNAAELGIDPELVDRAEQAARDQLRKQFEDELAAFAGQNPFVAQLDELKDKFDELTRNAIALGLGTEQVDEAYRQALETMQRQFQEGIQGFLDYGQGLSDLAVRHRDLTKFFDEQREAARALDEALGFTGGGGPNERLLGEAEAAAFQQLVDEFKASLQDLRDAGLTPTEIAVRDMRDRFAQLREDAALLGLSVDELTRLEVEAIERLRGELDSQLDRYLLSEEEQQQRAMDEEFRNYLRDALSLYTYEPGMDQPLEPEPFPGAHELELAFADTKTASQELAHAFRLLRDAVQPDGTIPPPAEPPPPGTGSTPGEIVASVLDFLEPLREGRGMDDLPADQREAIDDASTQVSLLLEQLRLGMTDDVGALQGALGNLVGLLEQSGLEIDDSLLSLMEALGSGDIAGFLDDLRNGVIGSADGFGALIDILLSGGDMSLPDLMHQLANGTFDAIAAMLGLTELPEELAAALQRIGKAYEAAQRQQTSRRSVDRGGGDAGREVEQREREREALLKQLEQFESLALSPTEREIRKLNEQFDEMRANAGRLGVSLDRVEAAYQLAIEDQRKRVLSQLEPFEDLALSPAERELKALDKQFDEIRASAALLGISMERVEAAYQLALEDRRQQERTALLDQLEQFEDLALTPAERELKALNKQFAEIRANAERLGIPMERVEAAYQLALEERRRQEREAMVGQLEQYEDLELSPVQRELNRINEQFDEMRANAERLGISLERVEEAYQIAIQQQRDALIDQLKPYEDLALSPAQRELNQLNEQFDEMRANAALLGVSLERVEAAYQQAIEDFWERLLGPLRDFREGLDFSELSTLTPEQRLAEAQARFDELTALALGGDLEAAQQLQGAAQQLLQEAQSFYASGEGYQSLFALVTGTVDQILATLPTMLGQPQAAEGFDALLAEAGWGYQDSLAARGIPFSTYPGDTHREPVELPFLTGVTDQGKPALAVDLTGVREDNLALREELRLGREQEHVDAVELQRRVDQQSEELKELRALLRRLTSTTQYGGRAQ